MMPVNINQSGLRQEKTTPEGSSFINLIQNSRLWGLFPNDYHYYMLSFIDRAFALDTNAARNAALWARKDILLTDAFFQMAKDLKQGRIPYDSCYPSHGYIIEQ